MAEREIVLDEPQVMDEQAIELEHATERAERAEAELAKLKGAPAKSGTSATTHAASAPSHAAAAAADAGSTKEPPSPSSAAGEPGVAGGEEELRKDSMMAHLLDSLAAGKDIGHYGRLVFAMVARHFLPHAEVLAWMTKDQDFSDEDARVMLKQVEGRDYSPPKRERILEWQAQQEFPILPNVDDPDCGNLYRNLSFPEAIYKHIGHYQEQKMDAEGEQS